MPFVPAMEEMETMRPFPEAFRSGANVLITANCPRQFTWNMRSISSSSRASRSACGTGLVNPAALMRMSRREYSAATFSRSAISDAVSTTSASKAECPLPSNPASTDFAAALLQGRDS